ncbi:L-serine ammonia-lyase, iron-sulfur-dependent, subunit alpha [Halanaerobium sp. DL-01]|uniref:L-serine ammonia-lyase, iron-sulfur-dependent, subunit alpha n=1 Tax=Halanaerobium sp. DL-01 TaxID=1653064 RepID=UPI000DF18B56
MYCWANRILSLWRWWVTTSKKQESSWACPEEGQTSGVYCDGAKGSCAFKAATAAELAVRHFELMVDGVDCYLPSGFISRSLDKTFENLAAISHPDEHSVNNTLFKVVENNFVEN